MNLGRPDGLRVLMVRGAMAVAAGRVALGAAALVWPAVPSRPWVGGEGGDLASRVFGRALGGRDLALGLGALAALGQLGSVPAEATAGQLEAASAWLAAGALADTLDVAASLAAWRELPPVTGRLVLLAAAGAALTGAAGAMALRPAPGR